MFYTLPYLQRLLDYTNDSQTTHPHEGSLLVDSQAQLSLMRD